MSLEERLYRINGLHLNVVDHGDGPPVLLLHGFPDSLHLWRHQIPVLAAAGFRVVAFDQRGYGHSDAPAGRDHYALSHTVADALALLDTLGIREKVRVVGHDWGAVVAWLLALHHPDRVERLVAVSVGHPRAFLSAGLKQTLRSWYAIAFMIPGLGERLVRARHWAFLRDFSGYPQEAPRWIADLSRPGRLTAALNWYRANGWPSQTTRLPHARLPVLGIWSTRDAALTEQQMTNSSRFVDAPWRYERLEGISHWIPLEAPDRLNELLLEEFRDGSIWSKPYEDR